MQKASVEINGSFCCILLFYRLFFSLFRGFAIAAVLIAAVFVALAFFNEEHTAAFRTFIGCRQIP